MSSKQNKKKNFWQIAAMVFYIIVVLVVLLILISTLPIPGNYHFYTVMSGSMVPKIKTGTLMMARPAGDYNPGDIITFRPLNAKKSGDIVTHRIVEIKEKNGIKTFITKGDANNAPDADELPKNRIIGKYLFGIPFLGYVVGYAKTLPGLILLVIIPATVIVLEESKKIIKEIKKIRKRRAKEHTLESQEAK